MIKIYKKCEKSIENPMGTIEIDIENYNNPFLLCISSQEKDNKSVFGLIKEGARAARVRTTDEYAAGYKIDEMPVDFLGIKFDEGNNNYNLCDFIYDFLKRDNNIVKQARKINFFTYCNATRIYVELEKQLKEKLSNDGYSEKEISEILSQISLISIGSKVDISKISAAAIIFKDANDREIFDNTSKIAMKKMNMLDRETYIGYLGNDKAPAIFTYNGSGNHELREYFKDDSVIKCPLCAAVSTVLDNSISNTKSDDFIPISSKLLLQVAREYNGEFENNDSLFEKMDNKINYNNTPKYTIEDEKQLLEQEKQYLEIIKERLVLSKEEKNINIK